MEEILASIRKMIPEEETPPPASAEPAPEPSPQRALLLTRMVAEDGSIVRLEPAGVAPAPPSPPMAAMPPPAASPPPPEDVLLLTNPMPPVEPAKPEVPSPSAEPPAPAEAVAGETMEAFLRRILEPELKAWLNANLPPMVERMVQKVIDDVRREVDAKDDTP